MLLRRSALPLALQHIETLADQWAGFSWKDDLVHIPKTSSNIRICKLITILFHKLSSLLRLVLCLGNLLAEDDVDCTNSMVGVLYCYNAGHGPFSRNRYHQNNSATITIPTARKNPSLQIDNNIFYLIPQDTGYTN